MEARQSVPQPVYPPRRWPWVVGILVALAIAAPAVWYFAIRDTGSSDTVQGPEGTEFTITRPAGWESLPQDELQSLPGNPLAVLRETDGTGIVIVNSQPQTAASLPQLSKQLQSNLKKKIPDFRLLSSKLINLPAGQAIAITYVRTDKGTANRLVVVPAGGHVYTLNTVVPSGQERAARQADQIVNSFNA